MNDDVPQDWKTVLRQLDWPKCRGERSRQLSQWAHRWIAGELRIFEVQAMITEMAREVRRELDDVPKIGSSHWRRLEDVLGDIGLFTGILSIAEERETNTLLERLEAFKIADPVYLKNNERPPPERGR